MEPYFGNPILIEVKGQLHTASQAQYAAEQILHYMELSHVTTAIIFAARLSSEAIKVVSSYPNLYFFDLRDF